MATDRRQRRALPPSAAAASSSDTEASSPSFPVDLINAIAARLTTLQDFFALRAACRSYRALLPPCRSTLASQAPLLVLTTSTYTSDGESYSEALCHLPLRRRFCLTWGRTSSRLTLLYAHGFLIIASSSPDYRIVLLLLHLISGEQLRLPKAPAPFRGVVLSSDLLTVLFTPRTTTVQCCRPGDALWQVSSIDATQGFEALFFHPGVRGFVLSESHTIRASWRTLPPCCCQVIGKFIGIVISWGESDELSSQPFVTFMLGECGGGVLLIKEDLDTLVYSAFRREFGEAKWVRVTSLGVRTIFLNNQGLAACIGPGCPGNRGDGIYAARPCYDEWREYSLVNGTSGFCYALYPGATPQYNFSPQVWVFPVGIKT